MPSDKRKLNERELAKRGGSKPGEKSFFQEQLIGEEALSFATAKRLFGLAEETLLLQPWRALADTELVLVKDPELGGLCFCGVMGALGEVFAIHAYRGLESYRLFKKIVSGASLDSGEFFIRQHSVTMEFLTPGKLSQPDRELALVMGHPLKKGMMASQFRAGRPGYRPWYPTESEGKVLALCVESVLAFCEYAMDNPGAGFWKHEDVYPQVIWTKNKFYRVEIALVPVTEAPQPDSVPLDEGRLKGLRRQDFPLRGIIEVDQFYSAAPVGEKNQRKACLNVVMSVDAETGFLYVVGANEPSRPIGEMLLDGVLQTIEKAKFVPAQVHVRDEIHKSLLDPLKERFGFEVRVSEKLPALEFAKKEMHKALGI